MTGVLPVLAGLLGIGVGAVLAPVGNRWPAPVPVPAGSVTTDAATRSAALRIPRPLPELATGALWALTALRFGLSWELPPYLLLAAVGVLLAVVDLRTRLLPDRVVLPATAAAAVLLGAAALAEHRLPDLGRAVAGGAVLFAAYLVLALLKPSGLGFGDVKLAGLLGLCLGWGGWGPLVLGTLMAFAVQGVLAALLLVTRQVGLRGELPFGPAMLAGAGLAVATIAPLAGVVPGA